MFLLLLNKNVTCRNGNLRELARNNPPFLLICFTDLEGDF